MKCNENGETRIATLLGCRREHNVCLGWKINYAQEKMGQTLRFLFLYFTALVARNCAATPKYHSFPESHCNKRFMTSNNYSKS